MQRLSKDEFHRLGQLLRPAGRQEAGVLLVPGFKCAQEFVSSKGRIELVVVDVDRIHEARQALGQEAWRRAQEEDRVRAARPHELARLADQPHPEGLVLAGRLSSAGVEDPKPPHLVLDGVQDPGNVGSMLRTALWFGMDRVWLLTPCADPFSPRVIRASMGAAFHLASCRSLDLDALSGELATRRHRLLGLDTQGGVSLADHAFASGDVLVLGSESHGLRLRPEALHLRLAIPGAERMESLNVGHAMAICAWQRWSCLRRA